MKKFLVFTLILTLIFPAYCFSYPKEAILVEEELQKLPINEELIDEIMLILEDGVVEQEEVENLIGLIEANAISISQELPSCGEAFDALVQEIVELPLVLVFVTVLYYLPLYSWAAYLLVLIYIGRLTYLSAQFFLACFAPNP